MNREKEAEESVLRVKPNSKKIQRQRDNTLARAARGSSLTAREREQMNIQTFEERRRADIENRAIQRTEESSERKTGEFHDIKRSVKKTETPVPYEDARHVPTPEQWYHSQKELKKDE